MKEKTKEKLSLFLSKVKDFNITKYLLNKKERKLQTDIGTKEDLIEFYQNRIITMKVGIVDFEKAIITEEKAIKQLETDVKKLVKVINLYID